LSLFPNKDNILTKEIESWSGFADSLKSEEDKTLFLKMLNDCYKCSTAINAKGKLFPAESLLIALLFSQHKVIGWLTKQVNICSSCTSVSSASTSLQIQEKERQQIKEWHNRVFKDIKKYDCLSREELNRFRLADDDIKENIKNQIWLELA
jgi:hypothetical protein